MIKNDKKQYGLIFEETNSSEELIENKNYEIKELKDFKLKGINKNLLIEGDNLISLNYLKKEYKSKIDIIYIDPPYNTGKKFKYNDSFINENHIFEHSEWLSFMKKRLEIAYELLSDNGIMFISIDDNEHAYLKVLCDSIFVEKNSYIGSLIRKENAKKQKIGKPNIKIEFEYVLVYKKKEVNFKYIERKTYKDYLKESMDIYSLLKKHSKVPEIDFFKLLNGDVSNLNLELLKTLNKKLIKLFKLQGEEKGLSSYSYIDENGLFMDDNLNMSLGRGYNYKIVNPFDKLKFLKNPKHGLPSKEKFLLTGDFIENKDGNIEFKDIKKIKKIEEDKFSYSNIIFKENTAIRYKNYMDIYSSPESILNGFMGSDDKLLQKIGLSFDYPKRTTFLKYLINMVDNKNALILDFFAGSGTTGQAVLELNEEDGGNREFILCTNNEVSENIEIEFLENKSYITEIPRLKTGIINKKSQEYIEYLEFKNTEKYFQILDLDEYVKLGICRSVTYPRLKTVITGFDINNKFYCKEKNVKLTYFKINSKK